MRIPSCTHSILFNIYHLLVFVWRRDVHRFHIFYPSPQFDSTIVEVILCEASSLRTGGALINFIFFDLFLRRTPPFLKPFPGNSLPGGSYVGGQSHRNSRTNKSTEASGAIWTARGRARAREADWSTSTAPVCRSCWGYFGRDVVRWLDICGGVFLANCWIRFWMDLKLMFD